LWSGLSFRDFQFNLPQQRTICSGVYFFIGTPAFLQSEFPLAPAGTRKTGHANTIHSFMQYLHDCLQFVSHEKPSGALLVRLDELSRQANGSEAYRIGVHRVT